MCLILHYYYLNFCVMKKFLLIAFSALSSVYAYSQNILSEDFESGSIPSTWTILQTNPNETWHVEAITGDNKATVNYDETLGAQDERLVTPSLDLSTGTYTLNATVGLSYYWAVNPENNYDVFIEISTDNGSTWTQLWSENDLGVFTNWVDNPVAINLAPYAGNANVKVAFHYVGTDGAALYVDDVIVSLNPTAAPSCATLNSPANGATNVNFETVTLSWTAPTTGGPVSTYDVYMDTNPNPTTLVASVAGTSTTYTPTNVLPNTMYYWKIVPKNAAGDATGCTTNSFTTGVQTVPGCPTLTAPANGATDQAYASLALTWTAPTTGNSVDNYDIYLDTNPNPTTLVGTVAGNVTTYTVTNLMDNTTYYWRVVPKNEAGEATGCTAFSFTTRVNPAAPYCGPLEFTATAGTEPITLVNFAGINNVTDAAVNGTPDHEFFLDMIGNVATGQTYTMTLQGNTGGNYTNRFIVFIDWNQDHDFADAGESYPVTATLLNSTGTDGKQVTADIAVPADALAGNTRMRVKKQFSTGNYNNPCLGTSYGQAEDYTLNVTTAGVADVSRNQVNVYPNPVGDVVNVNAASKIKNIAIFDASGKAVSLSTANSEKAQINMSSYAPGIYILKVEAENGTHSVKLIKK